MRTRRDRSSAGEAASSDLTAGQDESSEPTLALSESSYGGQASSTPLPMSAPVYDVVPLSREDGMSMPSDADSVRLCVNGIPDPIPRISELEEAFLQGGRVHKIWRIELRQGRALVDVERGDLARCLGVVELGPLQVQLPWNRSLCACKRLFGSVGAPSFHLCTPSTLCSSTLRSQTSSLSTRTLAAGVRMPDARRHHRLPPPSPSPPAHAHHQSLAANGGVTIGIALYGSRSSLGVFRLFSSC